MPAGPAGEPAAERSGNGSEVLVAHDISRSFGSTQALQAVHLALTSGEIHALVGENGAGKSTLVKILAGALPPDAGRVVIRGIPVRLAGVRDALRHGIVPIYQHLSLMPHLSVWENLAAFDLSQRSPWSPGPRRKDVEARGRRALARIGLHVSLHQAVSELTLAERQLVEIARGLLRRGAVLLLDEPTASLNGLEATRLFSVLRDLRRHGWAMLFISHRLDEVEEIADRVSVLRDGRTMIEGARVAERSRRQIVEAMVGQGIEQTSTVLSEPGAEALTVERLSTPGAFCDVSFDLRRGEILGVVGLIGSGALELGAALAGAYPLRSGRIRVGGRPLRGGDRAAALAAGIGFIPVDRESEGIFPTLSALQNGSASILGELARLGFCRKRDERDRLVPWFRMLAVRPESPEVQILTLSGGNRQKVLFIRSFASNRKRVLIALEPSRGVDIKSREEIRRALLEAARSGLAIVVVSSDLEEVTALSHRLVVMREGRAVAEVSPRSDPSTILAHLTGAGS
jgi:ABC-type sugar transport system ATPase subunit